MKDWEIIADNLSKAGWSLGWVSALDVEGQTIWIVDAHGYGKRFIVRADEELTTFLDLVLRHALVANCLTKQTLCLKNCHPARIADLIAG